MFSLIDLVCAWLLTVLAFLIITAFLFKNDKGQSGTYGCLMVSSMLSIILMLSLGLVHSFGDQKKGNACLSCFGNGATQ